MKNTFDQEVEAHKPAECKECSGSGFYKTPYGCKADECEDENNCYCDCHQEVTMT